jgi:hypothetical protein
MPRNSVLGILVILIVVLSMGLYFFQSEGFDVQTFGAAPVTNGILCQAGFWCPTASGGTKAFPCPGGTYGSTPGLKVPQCTGYCKAGCVCKEASTEQCPTKCPQGYYCVAGTGGPTSPIICPQGYFCPEGSDGTESVGPKICPAGAFCPLGTSAPPPGLS